MSELTLEKIKKARAAFDAMEPDEDYVVKHMIFTHLQAKEHFDMDLSPGVYKTDGSGKIWRIENWQ